MTIKAREIEVEQVRFETTNLQGANQWRISFNGLGLGYIIDDKRNNKGKIYGYMFCNLFHSPPFYSFEEAKQWCQSQLNDFIQSIAEVSND